MNERKIGSRWYRRIDPKGADVGDWIEYRGGRGLGRYWAKVAKVSPKGLRTEPVKYKGKVLRTSKLIRIPDVESAWRKGRA